MKRLPETIAELYRVFAPCRIGNDFTGCPHCVDPSESARLASTPLRELSISDLDHYAVKAMTTWGTVKDFKHFLPRLFELAAQIPDEFLMLEVLFGKLAYGRWEEWNSLEVEAVDSYLSAFWLQFVESDSDEHQRIDTILCAIGNARGSMKETLCLWLQLHDRGGARARNLARLVLINMPTLMKKRRLENAHWGDRSAQEGQVVDWLADTATLDYLRMHLADLVGDSYGQDLVDSIVSLEDWRQYQTTNKAVTDIL